MSYNTVGIIKNGVKQKLPVVMVAPKVDGPDYAEVVADGVKTYATLFTELASLVDNTKVNPKSVFTIDSDVYVARYYEELIFYNAQISSAKSYVVEARIQSHMFIEVEAGATYQDMSNNVPTSGRKFTLYYNTATLDLTTRASNCVYDNSNSGLSATDAQGAIDEVAADVKLWKQLIPDGVKIRVYGVCVYDGHRTDAVTMRLTLPVPTSLFSSVTCDLFRPTNTASPVDTAPTVAIETNGFQISLNSTMATAFSSYLGKSFCADLVFTYAS